MSNPSSLPPTEVDLPIPRTAATPDSYDAPVTAETSVRQRSWSLLLKGSCAAPGVVVLLAGV